MCRPMCVFSVTSLLKTGIEFLEYLQLIFVVLKRKKNVRCFQFIFGLSCRTRAFMGSFTDLYPRRHISRQGLHHHPVRAVVYDFTNTFAYLFHTHEINIPIQVYLSQQHIDLLFQKKKKKKKYRIQHFDSKDSPPEITIAIFIMLLSCS